MTAPNYQPPVAGESLENLRAREARLETAIAQEKAEMLRLSVSITNQTLHLSDVKKAIAPLAFIEQNGV